MTDYISGKIAELTPTQVVIDNNGIGHISEISLQTFQALDGKTEAKVWIQSQINPRDGIQVDYGFASKDERELFRLIISVSGMGASSARMMLSSLSSDELREAIISENINLIKSVKGLGLKTAQRLILELKDKVDNDELTGSAASAASFVPAAQSAEAEAIEALMALGYPSSEAAKAVSAVAGQADRTDEILRLALRSMAGGR